TDGLADCTWPAWDASGKYLWFLASTDLGLRSQWLDMTSYDHNEDFGLYLAVLKKGDASPLLPESDEERGPAPDDHDGAMAAGAAMGASSPGSDKGAPKEDKAAKPAVKVTIDFDGLSSRILSVPGVPEKPYALLKAGAAGTVYYIEQAPDQGAGSLRGTLMRYKLSDRKAATFANEVA